MPDHTLVSSRSDRLALGRPVVLVGLMGAGKSTIGKRLARELELDFLDSDSEIAAAAGCSVSDIFEIYGEAMFRDLERRVLLRLLAGAPAVIATGGGAFMDATIREAVLAQAVSVWLKAGIDVLVERVSRRDTRPLLAAGDKRETLLTLMEQRHPVYAQADIAIDSGTGPHELVVRQIAEKLAALQDERS